MSLFEKLRVTRFLAHGHAHTLTHSLTMFSFATRTIWLLSLVSLFTDMASEMLYPIMPMYLRSIGFSILLIGVLEGIAEATAGLSKGYFGHWSDAVGRRRPFVQLGYSLSAVSKPMMALLATPVWIFIARTTDRLGKGIRAGARDAMLSAETSAEYKGRVFGFHRGFDTLGAVFGPLLALLFLVSYPGEYRSLFLLAFIPGVCAVLFTVLLKERPVPRRDISRRTLLAFLAYWRKSPRTYRQVVGGFLVFALINSSDVLLLLLLRERGASDVNVILAYVFYNIVYAVASYPLGALGDRVGMRTMYVVGLVLFAIVYAGATYAGSFGAILGLFGVYGIYAASTEGISKAWITNLVPQEEAATAIGFYTGFQSLAALIASSATGILWASFGPIVPFLATAGGSVCVAIFLVTVPITTPSPDKS
jgi:MFS family permease